jgi:hypothetical protein
MKKQLPVFLSALLLMPYGLANPAIAGVRDVQEMQQRSNGTFQVTCLNREVETVSADQILQNNVCNPRTTERIRFRHRRDDRYGDRDRDRYGDRYNHQNDNVGVICSGDNFFDWYYITRISDGKKLSDKMPLAKCRQAVTNARRGMVCSGDSFFNWFYLTRITDETKLGDKMSLDNCIALINDVR